MSYSFCQVKVQNTQLHTTLADMPNIFKNCSLDVKPIQSHVTIHGPKQRWQLVFHSFALIELGTVGIYCCTIKLGDPQQTDEWSKLMQQRLRHPDF